jgi:hypothetical protein
MVMVLQRLHGMTVLGSTASADYAQHRPDRTLLYEIVAEHLETFLDEARSELARGVPKYVERDLRAYLACGIHIHPPKPRPAFGAATHCPRALAGSSRSHSVRRLSSQAAPDASAGRIVAARRPYRFGCPSLLGRLALEQRLERVRPHRLPPFARAEVVGGRTVSAAR